MRGLIGRGPVLVGLAIALAIPLGAVLVLIDGLYPGGLEGFCVKVLNTMILGMH